MLKNLEKPVFEIEEVENPLGKLDLLNPVGKILDVVIVMSNPVILRFVKAAVGDERTDGFHLTGVEPDTVITADIDYYP